MAKRIEVTTTDGTEGWIDLSASLEKAAMSRAWDNNEAPEEAIEAFLLETFSSDGPEEDSDEADEEDSDEDSDEE